jgi:hypothetical protein
VKRAAAIGSTTCTACARPARRSPAASTPIVLIEVREARPVVSPAYDDGLVSEADMARRFRARFAQLHQQAG